MLLVKELEKDTNGNPLHWLNGELKYVEVGRPCECAKKKRATRLLEISEITPEFLSKTISGFNVEDKPQIIKDMKSTAIDYFKAYDSIKETRTNSIALLGQPGSGKTHLLSALANSLIQKKLQRVLYFPFIEGFNNLKSDMEALNSKLEEMNRVDVLFIDDLFKGKFTDWEFKQMMAVVNYRYLNNKPIMISSELTLDELCDIDEALGSRIYEMTKNYTLVVKGDRWTLNHRLQEA